MKLMVNKLQVADEPEPKQMTNTHRMISTDGVVVQKTEEG